MTGEFYSGTRRVNLVTNPIISRDCGKDQEVFYDKWNISVVIFTQTFHSGQTSHGGIVTLSK